MHVYVLCVCACACVCVCMCVHVRAWMHLFVHVYHMYTIMCPSICWHDVHYTYDNTAELNKTTQVLSEVTEQWMSIEQLLSDSQTTLVTIIERNAYFNNISNTVDQALNNSKIRNDNSEVFLQNRTQENITVHGISNQLKMLQAVLEDIYSLSSNVSSTVNNTLVYNRNLNKNITRLQVLT